VLGADTNEYAKPDCLAPLHESLKGWWWVPEILPRRYFDRSDPEHPQTHWTVPLGRPRRVAPGSSIHESVFERMNAPGSHYQPPNLPGIRTVVVGAAPKPALL
jgi:hypothetical protein